VESLGCVGRGIVLQREGIRNPQRTCRIPVTWASAKCIDKRVKLNYNITRNVITHMSFDKQNTTKQEVMK
jgi:hypothetical protein